MSTTIQFYHLLSTSLERAVPKLMEKALSSGGRVVVLVDEARLKNVSDALWLSNPNGFLPHGAADDKHAADQPIILASSEANPNSADILCILDGSTPASLESYAKVLDVFDGADSHSVTAARARWAAYKEQGHKLQYIKQQPGGGWKIESESETASAA